MKSELKHGEQKSLQTDRVILVPGPEPEVGVVRHIFRMFIDQRLNESEIARALNADGGHQWTRGTVHQVLTNEKYIGHNVYNRVSFKLKKKRVKNPPEMWVRSDDAFDAIVDPKDFYTARGMILERRRRMSDEEMLVQLRSMLEKHGRLSALLIDETEGAPSSTAYRHRFGSLIRAYECISYAPERDYSFVELNRELRKMHPKLVADVVDSLRRIGGAVHVDPATDLLTVNQMFTASIVLAKCTRTAAGSFRWNIRFDHDHEPDLTVAVRLDAANSAALDYFLLPALDMDGDGLRLAEENGIYLDTFRFDSLDFFIGLAEQVRIEEAA